MNASEGLAKQGDAPDPLPNCSIDPQTHRQLGVDLFNHTWTLLRLPSRTPEQIDDMLAAAHASRFHWSRVGTPENLAIAHWQCSRAHVVAGQAGAALYHAQRNLDICREHNLGDFVLAYAHEALARASLLMGTAPQAEAHTNAARAAAAGIASAEDREHFLKDLQTLPPLP